MNKNVKFGVIGLGRVFDTRVSDVFLNELKNSEIVAICDKNKKKLKKFQKKFNCESFLSIDQFFKKDFDFVYIATESGNHYKHIYKAFINDKNVIVEKPPVLKVSELKKLDSIAKKKKLMFYVVFQNRFNDSVVYLKKQIKKIRNDIVLVNLNLLWSRPQKYYSDWHGNWKMDGGVLAQQGIHYVDLLNYLLGDPIKCISVISNKSNKLQAEDTHNSMIVYKNNLSCLASLTTSLRPKDVSATIEIFTKNEIFRLHGLCCNKIEIIKNGSNKNFKKIEKKYSKEVPNGYGLSHKAVFQKLIDSFLFKDKELPTTAIESLSTLKLVNMMYRSYEKNRWVYFKEKKVLSKLGF
tara:strand:- start:3078 stop:4130 length:1053 start_codon:yes stop_codon:yes gene_type:complete